MLKISHFVSGPLGNNGYLLRDETTGAALAVDAPLDSRGEADALAAKKIAVTALVITHGHFDHTAEAAYWTKTLNAPVLLHPADREWAEEGPQNSRMFGLSVQPFPPWTAANDGQIFKLGAHEVTLIHTPGHTQGGLCLLARDADTGAQHLFTGDTLFAGSIGRTDLPGGDTAQLLASIRARLLALPDETRVYPGHGDFSTIGEERRENPFLAPGGGYAQIGLR